MTVPFVAVTMEGGCCANPDQPEGQLPMTAPMIAGQILHFKGGWGAPEMVSARHPPVVTLHSSSSIRHPPFVTLEPKACRAQLFQGLTFDVKIDTLGE